MVLYLASLVVSILGAPVVLRDAISKTDISPFFSQTQMSSPEMIILLAIATVASSVVLLRISKFRIIILRLLEAGSILLAGAVSGYVFTRVAGADSFYSILMGGAFALSVLILHHVTKNMHNLVVLVCCAGGAILLGVSLAPSALAIMIGLLCIYDYVAVYKSNHMGKLAQIVKEEKLAMGFSCGVGKESIMLGTGDVIVPCALCASLSVASFSLSIAAGVGTCVALVFLMYRLSRKKEMIAALPILGAGTLLGLIGATLLLGF